MAFNYLKSVALISFPPFTSGITHYSYFLFSALSKKREPARTYFVCHSDLMNWAVRKGMRNLVKKTRYLPVSLLRVLWFVFRWRIRIIHFQSFFKYPVLTYILILLFRLAGKKTVFTVHDLMPHYQKAWDKFFVKKIYGGVDGIVLHSNTSKKDFLSRFNTRSRVDVIPHPLYNRLGQSESICDRETARMKIGLPKDHHILLFFGRIDRRKGAEAMIQEFPKIISKNKKTILVFAGTSAFEQGYLIELARKLDISDHVVLFERYITEKEVPYFFISADAVVLPYLRGTTSGVMKLAFSFKIPVIATRVGELPEVITKTNAGILIDLPFQDRDVTAVQDLLKNKNRMSFYSDYDQLLIDYSWENAADRTEAVYQEISTVPR